MALNWQAFTSPVLLRGDAKTAYRDPAVFYRNGCFYLYFTLVETEEDGTVYLYLAMTTSTDLVHFTPVRKLSELDRALNYSSPGNIIRFGGRFCLCCQTYCRENGEKYGNANCRIWLRRSDDLIHWDAPELLRVKGDAVPDAEMGRMIDPYLLEDREEPGKYWCFFKQNGVSLSHSRDLVHWEYAGHADSGENVCVEVVDGEYWLWHSPPNGIGLMKSRNLVDWERSPELITLGQAHWPWARGRLTAGVVADLRSVPEVGKALLFFHGTGPEDESVIFDQYACIGFAWSDDLLNWQYVE